MIAPPAGRLLALLNLNVKPKIAPAVLSFISRTASPNAEPLPALRQHQSPTQVLELENGKGREKRQTTSSRQVRQTQLVIVIPTRKHRTLQSKPKAASKAQKLRRYSRPVKCVNTRLGVEVTPSLSHAHQDVLDMADQYRANRESEDQRRRKQNLLSWFDRKDRIATAFSSRCRDEICKELWTPQRVSSPVANLDAARKSCSASQRINFSSTSKLQTPSEFLGFTNRLLDKTLTIGVTRDFSSRNVHHAHTPQESKSPVYPEDLDMCNAPISYQIPEYIFSEARDSRAKTTPVYWECRKFVGPEGQSVQIRYCRKFMAAEQVAQLFKNEKVVGFDLEWKPQARFSSGAIKEYVSLIQIASPGSVALFHIALFRGNTIEQLLPPTLKSILESSEITKVGVNILNDCTRLQKCLGIKAQAVFELSHLYKLVKYPGADAFKVNRQAVSLAVQVEEHLGLPLYKGDVRSSDWSKTLNWEQQSYAASDAYAGLHLYDVLNRKRKAMVPTPPLPSHAELKLPIRVAIDDEPHHLEIGDSRLEDGKKTTSFSRRTPRQTAKF